MIDRGDLSSPETEVIQRSVIKKDSDLLDQEGSVEQGVDVE